VSEPLLNILTLCLLALLYLFFVRVLQAVWAEVNGPRKLANYHATGQIKEDPEKDAA
jgi:hypothetical protein